MGAWPPCRLTRVADFSEDGTSYLSKIMWSSCKSFYFTSKRFVKCSTKSLQFLIHSGLSSDRTSAIPSTIATLNRAVISCVLVLGPPAFSRICTRALLQEQCNMVPSRANKDLGTTVNSYKPTASWMSISGRLLHTIAKRANRFLSSFNSMIVSLALTLMTLALVFQVRRLRFFTGAQRLIFLVLIRGMPFQLGTGGSSLDNRSCRAQRSTL